METNGKQVSSPGNDTGNSKKPRSIEGLTMDKASSSLTLNYEYEIQTDDIISFRFIESGSDYEGVFTVCRISTPTTVAVFHKSKAIPRELWESIKKDNIREELMTGIYRVILVTDQVDSLHKCFSLDKPSSSGGK